MKPSLTPQLGQHLTLTPALRQAIHLLSLSATELESEVNLALESNPLLERAEDADGPPDAGDADALPTLAFIERTTTVAVSDRTQDNAADAPMPAEWAAAGTGQRRSGEEADDGAQELAAAPEDLHDHLLWQLHLTPMSPRERMIGAVLIDAVGQDGYLGESLEAIRDGLRPDIEAGLDEIGTVLHRIQRFDPVGVAATSLSECLGVQLSMLSADTAGLALARRIASEHLETLARQGSERLAGQLQVTASAMDEAVALLRSLDPRPGSQAAAAPTQYVQPDCIAYRHAGAWKVALLAGNSPALAISHHYERLIAGASREDASYLRAHLQEARWLIKNLQTRADTVLRVAQAIVRQQAGFLDFGPEAMRPLTLREVAEELELHESTISRATTRKYLNTPRGTFEFKHFFASGIANGAGEAASSTAIQAMIRRLVDAEDPRKPLSDAQLASALREAGVPVARRTVAKYRDLLRIASSHERTRL